MRRLIAFFLSGAFIAISLGRLNAQALATIHAGLDNYEISNGRKSDSVFSRNEKRLAVLIGVSKYRDPSIVDLPNCANDIIGMRDALTDAGFDVITIFDKRKAQIDAALLAAADYFKAQGYDVAMVYFTGHGAQYSNIQMLAPADFELRDVSGQKDDLGHYLKDCVLLPTAMSYFNIQQTKCVLGLVDACRDSDYVVDESLNKDLKYNPNLNKIFVSNEGKAKAGVFYATSFGTGASAVSSGGIYSFFTNIVLKKLAQRPNRFDDFIRDVQNEMKKSGQMPIGTAPNYLFKFYTDNQNPSSTIVFNLDSISRDNRYPTSSTYWFYIKNLGSKTINRISLRGSWMRNGVALTTAIGVNSGIIDPYDSMRLEVLGAPQDLQESDYLKYNLSLVDETSTLNTQTFILSGNRFLKKP